MPNINTLTRNAAKQAYEMAGLGPEDLDLVELHDCFASAEMLHYGNLGLCKDEEAGMFVDDGYFEINAFNENQLVGGNTDNNHSIVATAHLTRLSITNIEQQRGF